MLNKFNTTSKVVPIDSIRPNRWNPNVQSDFIYQKAKDSIEEYGFIDPVLVRTLTKEERTDDIVVYEIIDGEHRWKGAKEKEYTEIKIEDYGELNPYDAMLLTMIMNNTRGKDDILKRVELISQLESKQSSLLPWTAEEIENQKKLLNFDFSQYNKQEDIEQEPTRVMAFNLTTAEFEVVRMALELTKKKDTKALLELVKDYLELRTGVSQFGDIFKE